MPDLGLKKYKVNIKEITPQIDFDRMKKPSCFIGVSMGNPNFNIKYLPSIIEWVKFNFDHCSIIIADYLDRHSLKISKGISEKDAIEMALSNGERTFNEYKKIIPVNDQFNIYRWQDEKFAVSQEYLTSFQQSIFTNAAILDDINIDCLDYLRRKNLMVSDDKNSLEEKLELCRQYIIEEMAFINHQAELGIHCSVYPGTQLAILKHFSLNKYPDSTLALKEVIYFDLKIKK
jgi:tRNA-dependent cyclodipeptide synthase